MPATAACQAPTHQTEVTGPESVMSMDASKRRSATGGHSAAGGEARSSHERQQESGTTSVRSAGQLKSAFNPSSGKQTPKANPRITQTPNTKP